MHCFLAPVGAAVAPGIFGLAGVMTNPQFQVVISCAEPKERHRSALRATSDNIKVVQRAVIEIVRANFAYPTPILHLRRCRVLLAGVAEPNRFN